MLEGEYRGSANSEGYTFDGVPLILSEKDKKWLGIKETFKF
jgi:dTDP-4-dehydrorhamnose 3,5-epimerase